MPNSIIVYRNPLEQALWEGKFDLIPSWTSLGVFVLTAIVVYFVTYGLLSLIQFKKSHRVYYRINENKSVAFLWAIGVAFVVCIVRYIYFS